MKLKPTYSSREVAALTGLPARQLQAWDSGGLLSPAIHPHRTAAGGYTERRYTPIELFELLVLAELRHRGFSNADLHAICASLAATFGARLFEATGGSDVLRLLTDGREVFVRTARGEVFNLLRNPTQPLLVVGDEGLMKELGASLRGRRKGGAIRKSGRSSRGRRPAGE